MQDEKLIARFSTEPEAAYHELLERHSPMLLRMIRRFIQDQDEIMEVYTSICERLQANNYRALRRFRGTNALAPWLSVVVANTCRDRFRKTRASSMPKAVIDQLSDRERLVFQYHYQERLQHEDIAEIIKSKHGMACSPLEVVRDLARINDLLTTSRRWLLLVALNANRPTLSIDEMRENTGYQPASVHKADAFEEISKRQALVEGLNEALKQLAPDDQLLILLRFEHGKSAPEIAKILHIDNPRYVYSRLRTVYNQLRGLIPVKE